MAARNVEWIKETIGELLERHSQGEQVEWDTTLLPTPQGLAMMLVIWLRGPILGTVFSWMAPVPSFPLSTPEQLEQFIPQVLAGVLEERSSQLRREAQAANGSPPPDLIIPGRGSTLSP